MTSLVALEARDLRAVIATFSELLREHRDVINRLNVYPVPDGDTGTNMSLTMASVEDELATASADASLTDVARCVAHGSLMGARGNSGVILSQMLRGLVADAPDDGYWTAAHLADALTRADELARQAVVRVVEGTMLSVARAAADGARAHRGDLTNLVRAARDQARVALAYTPEQLAVLKQAGVVDSGGTGLCLLYDALCHVVAGDALPPAPRLESVDVHAHEAAPTGDGVGDLRYEVMFLLDADDDQIPAFRDVWAGIGDSIVVVGGDGIFNCHVHTDDIGAAIEAGLDAGRPRAIRVTDLREQVVEERWVREAHGAPAVPLVSTPPPATAVVAVVVGEGVGRIFHSLGARELVSGGQSMNPATADLVAAVRATGSRQVVILPNNKNIRAVAEQVDALVDEAVVVVPTTSIVEGFAALLAYDPDASASDNQRTMGESARRVVTGEVTCAVRDTDTDAGPVRVGDWIGLGPSGVTSVADSIAVASNELLARLLRPEHELVTVIEGEGASPANTRRVTEFLAEEHPGVVVEVHHGGQPLYPYFFGIE